MSFPAPTASSRLPYGCLPERIRSWVDESLGSPVTSTEEQVGGMSPGPATRLRSADGTRAFLKAVGPELNPDTPTLFRREIAVLGLIGASPLWARLVDAYDEPGGWVALLIEDIDGEHPDLRDDATMALVLAATDALAMALNPALLRLGAGALLEPLSSRFNAWADAFDHLGDIPLAVIPAWVRARAPGLREQVRSLADQPMDTLVHWDIRDDNLLQRPDGSIVFVDWGQASIGPAWADPLLARLARVESAWFDDAVRRSPALCSAGDDVITAWLCGFAVFLAHRMQTAADVTLPGLKAFRQRESARVLAGAARRLGEA